MKFTIDAAAFKEAVAFVSSAAARSEHLAGVQIELLKGRIGLSATNLKTSAHIKVDVNDSDGDGALLVPVDKLKALADSLQSGDVVIRGSPKEIVVSQGGAKTSIKVMDAGLFPSIPKGAPKTASKLPSPALRRLITSAAYIAPPSGADGIQDFLKGLQMFATPKQLKVAASNGAVIACAEADCESAAAWSALVPGEALGLAAACLDGCDTSARIGINEARSAVTLEAGNRVATLQLRDVPVRDMREQLSKAGGGDALSGKPQFAWRTEHILPALVRAAAFAGTLSLSYNGQPSGARLELSANGDDGGIQDSVEVTAASDSAFRVVFDPANLARALRACRVDSVGVTLLGVHFLALRTPPEPHGVRTAHVLMSINAPGTFHGPPADAPVGAPNPVATKTAAVKAPTAPPAPVRVATAAA